MRKALLLLTFLLLLSISPVWAISNPTSISIGDVYVFRNLLKTGDQLYFVRYDVNYAVVPSEMASDTFLMAIYDGSTLKYTRPLNYYQHNIISIYLTSSQALTWQGSYTVRITGSPSVFSPLTEGVNMVSKSLGPGDYREKTELAGILVNQAKILQTSWGIPLLTSTEVFNTTGSFYFRKAIPKLASMEPTIFQTVVRPYVVPRTNYTRAYELGLTNNTGPNLSAAMTDIGGMLGVSGNWATFMVVGLGFLITAGVVYSATSNASAAVIISFPLVLGAAFVFGGPIFQLVLISVLVIGVLFGVYFLLMRFS